MKILVDMNLSPTWLATFEENEIEAVHWSEIGNPKAKDREILTWARGNGFVVFTHVTIFHSAPSHATAPWRQLGASFPVHELLRFEVQEALPKEIGL
jgi:predicted nuclease of predicted toxin-antitoxin system